MNYDAAYALQKAMKSSDEFKHLKEAEAKVEANEQAKALVREFMTLQIQAEYARMAGNEEAETKMKELQELSHKVTEDEVAREFLQAYTSWVKISEDIYRIISEPITEGMKILEQK